MNKFAIILLITWIGSVHLEPAPQSESKISYQNACVSKTTCRECIRTQNCAWCMQPDFGDKPRCFQPDLKSSVCPEEFILNPDNEQKFVLNEELTRSKVVGGGVSSSGSFMEGSSSSSGSMSGSSSSMSGSSGSMSGSGSASGSIVQISPQRVNLKLRISE